MWKRLQNSRGNRPAEVQVSTPTLIDTTLDRNEYGYNEENFVDLGQSQRVGTVGGPKFGEQRYPSRQPKRTIPPSMPLHESVDDQQARNAKQIKRRPASSVYSQPSPTIPDTRFMPSRPAPKVYTMDDVEISPPSSPELPSLHKRKVSRNSNAAVSPDVSPIEEMPSVTDLSVSQGNERQGGSSSIPVMRREKRRNQVAAAAANLLAKKDDGREVRARQSSDPRWDPLTGEPTTSSRGRPSQVKPAEFAPPGTAGAYASGGLGTSTTVTADRPQKSFGERVRRLKDNAVLPSERPAWKGASGRQKVVPIVTDNPEIRPLNIPRKSSKRATSPRSDGSDIVSPVSAVLSPQNEMPVVSHQPNPTIRQIIPSQNRQTENPISTSPTSFAPDSSSSGVQGHSRENDFIASPSPSTYNVATPSAKSPEPIYHSPTEYTQPARTPPAISQAEYEFRGTLKGVKLPPANAPPEISRFSVTTYAPSTVASTPRPSIDSTPPMPSLPQMDPSPVIGRRRPRTESIDSPKATQRKPMMNPNVRASIGSTYADSVRNSMAKNLPKSPLEAASESKDLISSLEARIDNLTRRRLNLEKSIHQMTELMPQEVGISGIGSTGIGGRDNERIRARREEEKRKVEVLREDLSEVKREEHELGLKLHRAWKREAEGEIWEKTSLWVRRVTE